MGFYRLSAPVGAVKATGNAYEVAGNASTTLRASASFFTTHLDIELAITNTGATPLVIQPGKLRATDRDGSLAPKFSDPFRCQQHPTESTVELAPGEACAIRAEFDCSAGGSQLETISVAQDGVSRDGAHVPIALTFELE